MGNWLCGMSHTLLNACAKVFCILGFDFDWILVFGKLLRHGHVIMIGAVVMVIEFVEAATGFRGWWIRPK